MIGFVRYILTASACLSIAYCAFRLFITNRTGLHQQRMFLAVSLVISLILPASGFTLQLQQLSGNTDAIGKGFVIPAGVTESESVVTELFRSFLTDPDTYILIYALVSALLLFIFLVNLIRLLRLYFLSERKEFCSHRILVNSETESPFSFFGWIFIPAKYLQEEEICNIVVHEGIHASQYHSADNILIELTTALMWFNPLVWMMKKSVHLLHEYLADEGAIGRGVDRIRYQSLLLNQAAGERLISLSSSFNNSLKKRMIMMTNYRKRNNRKGTILYMIPLCLIMFLVAGLINGLFPREAGAQPVPAGDMKTQAQAIELLPEYTQDTAANRKVTIIRSAVSDKPNKKNNTLTWMEYDDLKSTDTVIYVVDGKKVNDISTLSPDSIESISVLKRDNMIVIATKKTDRNLIVVKREVTPSESNEKILYIIDGNESDDEEIVKTIDPSEIESVMVQKGKERIKDAGKEGYDAILEITTKKK